MVIFILAGGCIYPIQTGVCLKLGVLFSLRKQIVFDLCVNFLVFVEVTEVEVTVNVHCIGFCIVKIKIIFAASVIKGFGISQFLANFFCVITAAGNGSLHNLVRNLSTFIRDLNVSGGTNVINNRQGVTVVLEGQGVIVGVGVGVYAVITAAFLLFFKRFNAKAICTGIVVEIQNLGVFLACGFLATAEYVNTLFLITLSEPSRQVFILRKNVLAQAGAEGGAILFDFADFDRDTELCSRFCICSKIKTEHWFNQGVSVLFFTVYPNGGVKFGICFQVCKECITRSVNIHYVLVAVLISLALNNLYLFVAYGFGALNGIVLTFDTVLQQVTNFLVGVEVGNNLHTAVGAKSGFCNGKHIAVNIFGGSRGIFDGDEIVLSALVCTDSVFNHKTVFLRRKEADTVFFNSGFINLIAEESNFF